MVVVALASLLLFWLPFITRAGTMWGINFGGHGTETIVQNFDGLNYLAVAKTLYDPIQLGANFAGFGNAPIYYAAHFPLLPLLIRSLNMITNGPRAVMLSIVVGNILLSVGLYFFFVTTLKNKKLATILASVALFFPARILSVRAVGSSEPLFIFLILSSLALNYRGKHWGSAVAGALAVLTRSTGIFLFGGFALAWLIANDQWSRKLKKFFPYLLMPITLFLLFVFYGQRYGNFWAYFNASAQLHPVFFPPLLIFSNGARWITGMWREEIIYIYLFYGVGIGLYLKNLKRSWTKDGFERLAIAMFGIVYGLFLLFIAHRDLGRYGLPAAPVALLGFAGVFEHKSARWLALLLIPIFLLGWQFVVANVQPVADWSALL